METYPEEEQERKFTQQEEDMVAYEEEESISKVSMDPEEEQELLSSKCTKISQQEEEDDSSKADKEEEEGATPKPSTDPEVLKQISDDKDEEEAQGEAAPQVEEEEYNEEEETEAIMKQMTGSMTKLPLEIIFDILSRLPIKTLSQSCRWVSKSWFKIILHPRFAQTQHAKALKSFSPCVTYWELSSKSFWLVDHEVFDNHGNSTRAYDPRIKGFGFAFDVVGACNGLICMHPDPFYYSPAPYFIFNPITRQSINLPKSPMYKFAPRTSGFGFDPVTKEYKVVRIMETCEVEIYTLGSHEWRRISDVPRSVGFEPVFVNGALHWHAFDMVEQSYVIVALDMTTEKFQEIPPPPCVTPGKRMHTTWPVGLLGGCLCFTDDCFHDEADYLANPIEIWVMKSYGVQSSWSKEYVFRNERFPCGRWNDGYEVIKLKNGELVLKHEAKDGCNFEVTYSENGELLIKEKTLLYYEQDLLHYYDPNSKVFQPILTQGIPSYVTSLRPLIHVGSLLSPKAVAKINKNVIPF